jgi:hypothetical protein
MLEFHTQERGLQLGPARVIVHTPPSCLDVKLVKLGLYGALQKFDKDSHGFYAALRSANGRGTLVILKGKLGAGTEEYPGLGYAVEELKNDDSLPPAARMMLYDHLSHPIRILVSPPDCADDELSSGAPGRKWAALLNRNATRRPCDCGHELPSTTYPETLRLRLWLSR